MIKSKELTDPNSCLSRARWNEMLFVLLGRDEAAPATILFWIQKRIELGKNKHGDPQIVEAAQCALSMVFDQMEVKIEDVVKKTLEEFLIEPKSLPSSRSEDCPSNL